MKPHNPSDPSVSVEIIHRRNRLKEKIAPETNHPPEETGCIDPSAIERAGALIRNSQDSYERELQTALGHLDAQWKILKTRPEKAREKESRENIHRYANFIKDIASTHDFNLMAHFSESLRNFIDLFTSDNPAHDIIIEAHLDTMDIAAHQNLKDEHTPQAQELKNMLSQAIARHR